MADRGTTRVLSEAQWKRLSPLIEAVRPRGKTEHHDLGVRHRTELGCP
jgi:hypothetical protein